MLGFSATHAGLSLMILMVTVNIGAGLGGQIIGRVRHYKRLPMAGARADHRRRRLLAWQADTMTPLASRYCWR